MLPGGLSRAGLGWATLVRCGVRVGWVFGSVAAAVVVVVVVGERIGCGGVWIGWVSRGCCGMPRSLL